MEYSVLTDLQAAVLEKLFERGFGELGFYLTGGTALSEFYLQHRYSDDLDLFTRESHSLGKAYDRFAEAISGQNLTIVSSEKSDEFARFFIAQTDHIDHQLKIELARDVPIMISASERIENLVIDSFEDIAVNKICAILNREPPEPKDFVDLYFITKESNYSIDYLLTRAKEKEGTLDHEFGILQFATNLMRVEDFNFLPRMIKPLKLSQLQSELAPKAYTIIKSMAPIKK